MTKTYVLGVDPGTTTGLALAAFGVDAPAAVWSDQLPWDEASDELARRLEELRYIRDSEQGDAIAVGERFIINAKTAQKGQQGAEDAMGMLGVLRRECRLTGVELAPLQQASAAKNMVRDDALRSMHFYAPGVPHANDAYRHVVFLAVRMKLMNPARLLG